LEDIPDSYFSPDNQKLLQKNSYSQSQVTLSDYNHGNLYNQRSTPSPLQFNEENSYNHLQRPTSSPSQFNKSNPYNQLQTPSPSQFNEKNSYNHLQRPTSSPSQSNPYNQRSTPLPSQFNEENSYHHLQRPTSSPSQFNKTSSYQLQEDYDQESLLHQNDSNWQSHREVQRPISQFQKQKQNQKNLYDQQKSTPQTSTSPPLQFNKTSSYQLKEDYDQESLLHQNDSYNWQSHREVQRPISQFQKQKEDLQFHQKGQSQTELYFPDEDSLVNWLRMRPDLITKAQNSFSPYKV
jgi:hypothetical protein